LHAFDQIVSQHHVADTDNNGLIADGCQQSMDIFLFA
jgi:hypothetical protein